MDSHVHTLTGLGIWEVEIEDEVTDEQIAEPISKQLMEAAYDRESVAAYVEALDRTRAIFDLVGTLEQTPPSVDEFSAIFSDISGQAMKQKGLFRSLYMLEGADSYTYRHSINVGILSSLIASLMNWSEERIQFMGMAGFLHDIGKTKVPREILLKPAKLTEEEFEIMRMHTRYGYELVQAMEGATEELALCALLHHERLDGTGYPEGRKGDEIPIECQVLSIADMFDAICSDRVYKDRTSPFEAAQYLWKEACEGALNVEVVSRFVRYIALMYVGAKARLNSGEEVEVILINQDEPMRPLVRRRDEFLDLRYNRLLTIDKMIG
ncbi:HD-GYP domain-containing protein [Brevibacillus sp. TJ4]|uniref:HD-GYP domain-containing protein n=1 Tax=Brevibacillus sp. TJ4 TaxID=3234853 RepID=UPI003B9E5515